MCEKEERLMAYEPMARLWNAAGHQLNLTRWDDSADSQLSVNLAYPLLHPSSNSSPPGKGMYGPL